MSTMASSSTILSQTLQSITVTKIEELAKQRDCYERRKVEILKAADKASSPRSKVTKLVVGAKEVDKASAIDLGNIKRWLDQSSVDPTIRPETFQKFEKSMRSKLDIGSRRFELADLYSRLLTEWIASPSQPEPTATTTPDDDSSDSFEMVESIQKERLDQLRKKFEKVVFEPLQTDEAEINGYLASLFQGDKGESALQRMRDSVSSTGKYMLGLTKFLDQQSMKWCIKALLKNELLNDEKKATLREFLKDEAVMDEIRDVLNMRFRNLKNWSWGLGDEGMPVVP